MQYLLILHIVGAIATGGGVLASWWKLVRNQNTKTTNTVVQWLAVFEVATGTGLALQGNGNIIAYCKNIGIYLSVITVTLAAGYIKEKQIRLAFKTVGINAVLGLVGLGIVLGIK